jgi:hypothetical protein
MFKMNAEQKKYFLYGISILGVIVGLNIAGVPLFSFKRTRGKWSNSKYPLLWDIALRGEAKTWNDYNFYKGGTIYSRLNTKNTNPFSEKLLTQMTIGEVIRYQNMSRSGIGQLWATGQFQVIPTTLQGMYGKAGLNLDSMYDEKNQQKIADALIDAESTLPKYLNGKIEDTDANLKKASLDMATIWSSLGVPYPLTNFKGQKRGYNQSYYASDTASVDTAEVQKVLRLQRQKLK